MLQAAQAQALQEDEGRLDTGAGRDWQGDAATSS